MTRANSPHCEALRRLKLIFRGVVVDEHDRGRADPWRVRIPAEGRLTLDGKAPDLGSLDRLFDGATLEAAAGKALAHVEAVARRGKN